MTKRILSLLLSLALLISAVPVQVSAQEAPLQEAVEATLPVEATEAPAEEPSDPEETQAPTEELPDSGETQAPTEELPDSGETQAPTEELPDPEETQAPTEEILPSEETEVSQDETSAPEPRSSNSCGPEMTWTLSADGTLTISGTGAMTDYGYQGKAPWSKQYVTKLVFSGHITHIGSFAFAGLDKLTEVVIPDTVTSIGRNAFSNSRILKAYIPASVTTISASEKESGPFYGDPAALHVYFGAVSQSAKWGEYWNGRTEYNYIRTSFGCTAEDYRYWTTLDPAAEVVHIPDGITTIPTEAFCDSDSLKSISIPSSVTSIQDCAFGYCSGLTSITIPESVTILGNLVFHACSGLTAVNLPGTLSVIPNGAFNECGALKEILIPEGVTLIDSFAFFGCSSLKTVDIPSTVQSIGSYAFRECTSLSKIYIPKEVKTIASDVFYDCAFTLQIYCGARAEQSGWDSQWNEYSDSKKLTTLYGYSPSEYSFWTSLSTSAQTVTIPEDITFIPERAFSHASKLESIVIPSGIQEIGRYAFQRCTGLTEVTICDGVTTLPDSVFEGCTALETVRIPSSVTAIEQNAFQGCASLRRIFIPRSVTRIYAPTYSDSPFLDCSPELLICCEAASAPSGWSIYWNCYQQSKRLPVEYNSVSQDYDLWGTVDITLPNVVIPVGITAIPELAFSGCTGLLSVSIPSTVTSIGKNAFKDCTALTTIYIPDSVDTISAPNSADSPFYGCSDALVIYCEAASKKDGWDLYWQNCSQDTKLSAKMGYTTADYVFWTTLDNSQETVIIPSGVTRIPAKAFLNCSGLKSVIFPSTVTIIESQAFGGCTSLTDITLPEGLSRIGSSAFEDCIALTGISIPGGVATIGGAAFRNCTALGTVSFAEGISIIGGSAFENCTALTEAVLPQGVSKIGDDAFQSCAALTSAVIPSTVSQIGRRAFQNCSSLSKLVIAEGVAEIMENAFEDCKQLASLTVPSTVQSIGSRAFEDCSSLAELTLKEGLTELGSYAFYNCDALRSVVIPSTVQDIRQCVFYSCRDLSEVTILEGPAIIDSSAFEGCSSLRSLRIPSTVESIGKNAFSYCTELQSLFIPDSVTTIDIGFSHINSIVYGCSSDLIIYCEAVSRPNGWSEDWCYDTNDFFTVKFGQSVSDFLWGGKLDNTAEHFVVPDGVTVIPALTFARCSKLKSVVLPASLTEVENHAFWKCSALETLVLPERLTKFGTDVFLDCTSLTLTVYPGSPGEAYAIANSIPYEYYDGRPASCQHPGLTYVEAVTPSCYEAGSIAYWYCRSCEGFWLNEELTQGIAPETVILPAAHDPFHVAAKAPTASEAGNLEHWACSDCGGLWLDGALTQNTTSDAVILPATGQEPPESVGIAQGTCGENLKWYLGVDGKLTISGTGAMPDYAEDRQPEWAEHIPAITDLAIEEGITAIGSYAFRDHSKLQNVSFPDSLKQISIYAFCNCSSLRAVQFPQGLETLEQFAFQYCTSLKEVVIPGSVTTLRHFVFANCTGLKTAVLSEGITKIDTGVFFQCTALESIIFPGTLATYIGGMLSGSDGIRQLTLPEGAVKLESLAFEYCTNLAEVTLPATVEEVQINAFYQCPNLRTVWISGMGGVFHGEAFPHSPDVELVVHPGSTAEAFAQSHAIPYRYWETPPVAGGTCGENLTWSLSAEGVLTISGTGAMEDYKGLVEPMAPWSDSHSDENGACVTSVVVEEGVTYIGDNAFYSLDQLAELKLPDTLTGIGTYAFFYCSALEAVELPDSVTDMDICVFAFCEGLKSARLSAGLTVLPQQTFSHCTSLTSISLPQGMTKCGSNAFKNCTALESVTLPESLTHILLHAFRDCTALKTLTVPQSVTSIGGDAFIGCTSLTLEVWPGSVAESYAQENGIPYVCLEAPEAPCEHPGLTHVEALPPTATQEGNREYWYCDACGTLWLDEALTQVSTPEDVLLPPTGEEEILPLALIPQVPETVRTEKNADGSYTLILNREDVAGGKLEFPLLISATEALNTKDLKWSTSDSRIASAKTDKTAAPLQGLVTVKAKASGACVITATNSKTKDTATLTVQIRDYTPRLGSAALTLNTSLSSGVETVLLPSYGNGIEAVSLHEYISKTKTYASEPSQRFSVLWEDGHLILDHTQEIKKGTVKLLLKALCANGETYEYKLSLKVVNTLPSVTVKQQGKLNLFFTDCETRLTVTAKGAAVRDVTLVEDSTASFTAGTFDPETGTLGFRLSEAYLQGQAALDKKLDVLIFFEGYDVPLKKSVTLTTEKKAPKLTLSQPSSVVNTALDGEHSTCFTVIGAPQGAQILVDAAFARTEVEGNQVTLTLTGAVGGTAAVHVTHPGWAGEVVLKHKVTVQSKLPAVKLKTGTLKLNALLGTAACAQTEFVLPKGVSDFAVTDMLCLGEYQGFTLTLEDGILRARLTQPELASNKTLKLYPILTHLPTGQQVTLDKALTLKVQIYSGRPSVTVSAAGKLDTLVPDSAITYTIKKLSNISGTPEAVRLEGIGAEQFRVALEGDTAVLTLNPEMPQLKGKTYKLKLIYRFGDQEAAANISVKVNQSNVKFAAVKPVSLYQSNSRLACVLELTAPEGASIESITLGTKTAPQLIKALGEDAITFLELPDGRVLVSFKVSNPAHLAYGKSYTLYLDITPKGNAENAQPTSLKHTVKTFQ